MLNWRLLVSALMAALISTVGLANPQICLLADVERLQNACIYNEILGQSISKDDAKVIDKRLKFSGYRQGLRINSDVSNWFFSKSITPMIFYSDNLNGGNANKTLTLGGIPFSSDDSFKKKEGILLGAEINIDGRYIYGEQQYVEVSAYNSFAKGLSEPFTIKTTNINMCSMNHISNSLYADLCLGNFGEHKKLSQNKYQNVALNLSKIITDNRSNYLNGYFGVQRYLSQNYSQNRILIGIDMINQKLGASGIEVLFGDPVNQNLATRASLRVSNTSKFNGKPLKISVSRTWADGGIILGNLYRQLKTSVEFKYPITERLAITFGASKTSSNIGYFESESPYVKFEFLKHTF